ncbi:MAG: ribonuclease H-like domain-containing protein [Pseudomonadota bacterium]
MSIFFHERDLPDDFIPADAVAVDTEAMGLHPQRDRLCLIQLSNGDGDAHLVRLPQGEYDAPNLKALFANPKITKIFHYARFDVGMIKAYLGVDVAPIYCTKIASKLVRTYTDRHGLKELLRELLSVDVSKKEQSSDWGADEITQAQREYAANDVLYLHALMEGLNIRLAREGRTELAQACFDFLPTRAALDLAGWPEVDIFAHS